MTGRRFDRRLRLLEWTLGAPPSPGSPPALNLAALTDRELDELLDLGSRPVEGPCPHCGETSCAVPRPRVERDDLTAGEAVRLAERLAKAWVGA